MIGDAREIGERYGIRLDTANKLCQSVSDIEGCPTQIIFKRGGRDMGDKGKKDKGKREQQKKAQLNPKEKRKVKKEKKK